MRYPRDWREYKDYAKTGVGEDEFSNSILQGFLEENNCTELELFIYNHGVPSLACGVFIKPLEVCFGEVKENTCTGEVNATLISCYSFPTYDALKEFGQTLAEKCPKGLKCTISGHPSKVWSSNVGCTNSNPYGTVSSSPELQAPSYSVTVDNTGVCQSVSISIPECSELDGKPCKPDDPTPIACKNNQFLTEYRYCLDGEFMPYDPMDHYDIPYSFE